MEEEVLRYGSGIALACSVLHIQSSGKEGLVVLTSCLLTAHLLNFATGSSSAFGYEIVRQGCTFVACTSVQIYSSFFFGSRMKLSNFTKHLVRALCSAMYRTSFDSLWLAGSKGLDLQAEKSFLGVSTSSVLFNFLLGIVFSLMRGLSQSILNEYRPSVGSRIRQIPSIILDVVEIIAESIFVAVLTPLLTFIPFLLVDIVVPSFLQERREVCSIATSLAFALLSGAIAAVFADPIFRRSIESTVSSKKKKESIIMTTLFFSSNNVVGGDRDVILLMMPYFSLLSETGVNLHGMMVDWQVSKRIIIFFWIASAYFLFGYFNLCGALTLSGKPEENIHFNIPLRRGSSNRMREAREQQSKGAKTRRNKAIKPKDGDREQQTLIGRKSPSMEIMELSMSPARHQPGGRGERRGEH